MPSLKEVIDMFGEFGFSERIVRLSLGAGNSAHNAFEGLLSSLQLKWADMNQELGTERLKELKPIYERLMGLKMTGRKTQGSVKAARKDREKITADNLLDRLQERRKKNVESFLGTVGDKLREKDKNGELDDAAKDRIRDSGLGDIWKN